MTSSFLQDGTALLLPTDEVALPLLQDDLIRIASVSDWKVRIRLVCREWRDTYDIHSPTAAVAINPIEYKGSSKFSLRWLGYSFSGMLISSDKLSYAHTLHLESSGITDLMLREVIGSRGPVACDDLGHERPRSSIHTLKLWYCTGVTDVSMLGDIHSLYLYGSKVKDLSMLGRVHTLRLSCCNGVTDVSMLGNVHTLDLSNCPGVTDVSMLGGVHTLGLSCTGVTDVSMLGGIHTLDLSGCDVTDVSMLGGVHALNLSYCTKVKDVSMLGRVHTLNLTGCTKVVDVSKLSNIHTLHLSFCTKVTDVSMLGGVHTLNLYECTGVTDTSMLSNIRNCAIPFF